MNFHKFLIRMFVHHPSLWIAQDHFIMNVTEEFGGTLHPYQPLAGIKIRARAVIAHTTRVVQVIAQICGAVRVHESFK